MIKLEIMEQDGAPVITTDWREAEARQMAAYRMRWLSRSGRWARTTDQDGRVRTFGQVPEGRGAPSSHYVVREVSEDGTDGAAAKVFGPGVTRTRAEDWRLDHRLGG